MVKISLFVIDFINFATPPLKIDTAEIDAFLFIYVYFSVNGHKIVPEIKFIKIKREIHLDSIKVYKPDKEIDPLIHLIEVIRVDPVINERLKQKGLSKSKIADELDLNNRTVTKYLKMSEQDFRVYQKQQLYKEKIFDSYVNDILDIYAANNNQKVNMAAIYE